MSTIQVGQFENVSGRNRAGFVASGTLAFRFFLFFQLVKFAIAFLLFTSSDEEREFKIEKVSS